MTYKACQVIKHAYQDKVITSSVLFDEKKKTDNTSETIYIFRPEFRELKQNIRVLIFLQVAFSKIIYLCGYYIHVSM